MPQNEGIYWFLRTNQFANAVKRLGSPAIYVIQTIEESRNYPLTGLGSKLVGE